MAKTARDMTIVKITVNGEEKETFQWIVDATINAEQDIADAKLNDIREDFTGGIKLTIEKMMAEFPDNAISMNNREITVTFGMKMDKISITGFESVKKRIKRD